MTQNQINYQKNLETERHNRIQEIETERANRTQEGENRRSNLARENLEAFKMAQENRLRSKALALEERGQNLNYEIGSRQATAAETTAQAAVDNAAAHMIDANTNRILAPSKIASNYSNVSMVDVQKQFADIRSREVGVKEAMLPVEQFVGLSQRDLNQAKAVYQWMDVGTHDVDVLTGQLKKLYSYMGMASGAQKYGYSVPGYVADKSGVPDYGLSK